MNRGLRIILEMVQSTDNYIYYAGTSGEEVARLFQGTTDKKGRLNKRGKTIRDLFECGGHNTSGCGTIVGTLGRPGSYQPANMTNGDPVYALIGRHERAVQYQDSEGLAGDLAAGLNGLEVAPVRYFIHESAETLAFRAQANFDYPSAHGAANAREYDVMKALRLGGGFAGRYVTTTVPK